MSKKITIDEVKRIAKLAKLKISDDQLDYYADEMDKIISYFNKLSEVDTSNTEPMTHVSDINNITSEDKIQKDNLSPEFIDDCPDTFGKFIKVPKILDKE
tara:strand:+ start:479 stop:778 length:300 start_codon:yes stop_codon:yes gene_type:complete